MLSIRSIFFASETESTLVVALLVKLKEMQPASSTARMNAGRNWMVAQDHMSLHALWAWPTDRKTLSQQLLMIHNKTLIMCGQAKFKYIH